MSANIENKAAVVAQIKESMAGAKSMVFFDYRGMTVEEATKLRSQFRDAGVDYKVLKNTLIRRAAVESNIEGLDPILEGPTAVAFGMNDPVSPAKILSEYVKKAKKTEIKGGYLDGEVLDAKGVETLSNIPSREVLIARLMGSMNSSVASFVRCVEEIRKKKEEEGATA